MVKHLTKGEEKEKRSRVFASAFFWAKRMGYPGPALLRWITDTIEELIKYTIKRERALTQLYAL